MSRILGITIREQKLLYEIKISLHENEKPIFEKRNHYLKRKTVI